MATTPEDLRGRSPMEDLRTLRRRVGWTQLQLAHKIDVAQSYVSDVESGRRPLTPDAAAKAAAVFGVGRDQLRQDTYEAQIGARLGPAAELVDEATKVATKSDTAKQALKAKLSALLADVDRRELENPAAVKRVLRTGRDSIDGTASRADEGRDSFGRPLDSQPDDGSRRDGAGRRRSPQTTGRDPYGRRTP